MPQLIAAALTSAGIGTTAVAFGLTGAQIIGYVAYTAVSALAMRALAPDVGGELNKGTVVNTRTATGPQEYVYGTVRKGGVISYIETSGDDNTYLHMVITLTGQPVDSIQSVYINDEIVTIDGSNNVTSDRWLDEDGNPTIRIKRYTGSQITADSDLVSETSVDSTFIGRGCAYLYVRMKYDQNVFSGGIPTFTAVVKGIKPHDPRTGTAAWSDNAALCIRDYIVSAYGLSDADVDDTYFSAAANDCDDLVATAGGGTQKRYRLNGVVNAQSTIGTTLQDMLAACNGTLFFSGGKWKLKVGVYDSSVKTFTLDDLRSEISLPTRSSRRDNFNEVVGKFIDADQDWIEADYPAITSATFLAEDNGNANTLDLSLNMVTDGAQAQRIAKQTLFRAREQMTFDAEFSLAAMGVEVGDTVSLTIAEYGWTAKTFQVSSWRLLIGDNGVTVSMTLRETSAAAFAWDAEEADIIANNTTLPSMRTGLGVSNLTASGGGRTQGDGTFINSAILSWTAATNSFVVSYDVEWKAVADSAYNATTATTNGIEITPLVDGVQYVFRVRAKTVSGVVGSWATVLFTGGGDTAAPSAPTSVSATGGFEYIEVKWTNPADADFNYVEVWENTSNSTVGATLIGQSAGNNFVRTNLGISETKWYFLKAVDYSGNKSGYTSGVSATTTFIDDTAFESGIYSLFTDAGLYAIRDVSSLPASGAFVGEKVLLTTDYRIYTWTGTAWEGLGASDFLDLTGSIAGSQIPTGVITEVKIADDAITTPKISANAVGANEIAANAITASKIAAATITGDKITANTITGGLLATSGIITSSAQINDAVVTNAKIANAAITSAKIGDLEVNSAKIANLTVGTGKITDHAVIDYYQTGPFSPVASVPSSYWNVLAILTFTAQGSDFVATVLFDDIEAPSGESSIVLGVIPNVTPPYPTYSTLGSYAPSAGFASYFRGGGRYSEVEPCRRTFTCYGALNQGATNKLYLVGQTSSSGAIGINNLEFIVMDLKK